MYLNRSPEYVASPPPDLDSGRNSPRRTSTFSAFSGNTSQVILEPSVINVHYTTDHITLRIKSTW